MGKRFTMAARRGAAGQQYAIVVGLVGVVALLSVTTAGGAMKSLFSTTGNTLTTAANSTGATSGAAPAATTAQADTTPDPFSFAAATGAAGALAVSNTVTPTGYDGPLAVAVSGGGAPKIRIAGGAAVNSGQISPGQSLAVELTAAAAAGGTATATVTLGTVSVDFVVTSSAVTPGNSQYANEMAGNGTAGISRLRYWSATITGNLVRFEWPIVMTSGASYIGGCSNANGYWQSLHSGCGNNNGVAGCKNYCAAIGMAYHSVNTNCSTGDFPSPIPSPVGRNIYADNSSGNPNGSWQCYQPSAYIGNGNNMAWCQCSQ